MKKRSKKTDKSVNKSVDERKFMEHHNNNTNVDINSNIIVDNDSNIIVDDDSYDSKISDKLSTIRIMFSKLGNIITNKDKKKIKKELYELENKNNLSNKEKKRFMIILLS